jgi:DNA-binding transcriptional MerR regulator
MSAEFDDGKEDGALRTIGEVSKALDIKAHVLRYWEQQFPILDPLKRSGGRRYYRPEDVALVERINYLVNEKGYTLKGAKQAIAEGDTGSESEASEVSGANAAAGSDSPSGQGSGDSMGLPRDGASSQPETQPADTPALSGPPITGGAPVADDGGLASFFGGTAMPTGDVAEELDEPPEPQLAGEPAGSGEDAVASASERIIDRDTVVERLKMIHRSLSEAMGARSIELI